MKITRTASGKQTIKMSKSEWERIGKKSGWMGDITPTEFDISQDMSNSENTIAIARDGDWNVEIWLDSHGQPMLHISNGGESFVFKNLDRNQMQSLMDSALLNAPEDWDESHPSHYTNL
jgi:hypothetical protein